MTNNINRSRSRDRISLGIVAVVVMFACTMITFLCDKLADLILLLVP